jgi:hypothetical protein
MKKKPPTQRRPQDVMQRFDRLLATMAPKAEPPPKKTETRRTPRRSGQPKPTDAASRKKNSTPSRQDTKH